MSNFEDEFEYENTYFNKVLIFTLEDLKNIFDLISDFCNKDPVIEITCTDKSTKKSHSIDNLIEYVKLKEICKIYFKGSNYELKKCIKLKIENDSVVNCYLNIEGPEEKVKQLRNNIESYLSNMEPSFLYKSIVKSKESFINVIKTMWWIFFAIYLYIIGVVSNVKTVSFVISFFGIVGILTVLYIFILNRARKKFFPMVTFVIGKGKKRYESWWKWIELFVFPVFPGIVCGLIFLLFRNSFLWLVRAGESLILHL